MSLKAVILILVLSKSSKSAKPPLNENDVKDNEIKYSDLDEHTLVTDAAIFPYVAAVLKMSRYLSAGALIDENWVLTAADALFLYASDASRGAILVHEMSSGAGWLVVACGPANGLQISLVKRVAHTVLIVVRLHHPGIVELDTTALRRRDSIAPLTVFGEHSKPVVLLGAEGYNVYLRHIECSDVLVWNTRDPYNASRLDNIHSAGPRLATTSVAGDPLKPVLLILDSDYLTTLRGNTPTYHKITFVNKKLH